MKTIKRIWKEKKYRWMAGFFALLMIYQALSPSLDVAANEIHKVHLADTFGPYYQQDITDEESLNEPKPNDYTKEIIKKEAIGDEIVTTYDESQEIVAERSENSKTYQVADGTYVQEVYFEPIHKKEGNEFVEIDNTLEGTRQLFSGDVIYENKDGLYEFSVCDDTMQMRNEASHTFTLINQEANVSVYDVKDNVILYSEAYPNIDMEYRLGGNKVATNFYINAKTDTKQLHFTIQKGDLTIRERDDALEFLDGNDVVFVYTKPMLHDGNQKMKRVDLTYEENDEDVTITLTFDDTWLNDTTRVYPVMMRASANSTSTDATVKTSYIRSKEPNVTSKYEHLYVGYDNGESSGNQFFGYGRTYIHISGLGIAAKKEIISADMQLWKYVTNAPEYAIQVGKTSGYVDPHSVTWNTRPSVTAMNTKVIDVTNGWKTFDITDYIKDIYDGKNNTIELKAVNETPSNIANIFLSEYIDVDPSYRPKIIIAFREAADVKEDLDINTFDSEMRIFSILNKGFEAMSFDGIAKPNSTVNFTLVKRGTSTAIKTFTATSGSFFVDPIYITKKIANTQVYPKENVNYTTDYIYQNVIPAYDVPYEYIISVKNGSNNSTKQLRSDAFIKYRVKPGDTLPRIASYYGITIDEIKKDNNLTNDIVKENDTLILRFKKDNPKVTADVYTPPITIGIYQSKYAARGPNCQNGICPVLDPINSTTGNYYLESNDITIQDKDTFTLRRYYNSTGPQLSNMFGNGFTGEIESYLSYDKDGNMLYFMGDGRIYRFTKKGNTFEVKPSDRKILSQNTNGTTITDLDTLKRYQFDRYGSLQSITDQNDFTVTIKRDGYGTITSLQAGEHTITFRYNERKLVSEVVLPGGQKTSYKYDKNRNLIEYQDARGNKEQYRYDANNFLTSVIDKNGVESTKNTYDSEGRVIRQTDGNGNVSTLRYQANQTMITNADGSEEVYTFDANYDTTSITVNQILDTSYTYDAYRNITSKTDRDGNVTRYTYDKSDLTKVEYPDGTSEEYRYDTNHHIIYHKDRDDQITTQTYSGNQIQRKEDNRGTTTYTYDANNRIIKEIDPFGATKTYTYSGNLITQITYDNGLIEYFAYDANGNTIKESDNQGKAIDYIYHANGEMIRKNYEDGTNEQWQYDANGNIIQYQDRLGAITTNTYDRNNNLLTSSKGTITKINTYNEINQLMSETDEQGLTTTYTYDAYGNKQSETDAYGNTTTYEYDANDHLIKTIDTFGKEEIDVYEHDNIIRHISKEGLITEYEYDASNREIKRIEPNGVIATKEYDGSLLRKEDDGKGTVIEHFYDAYEREIKTVTIYADQMTSIREITYDKYGNQLSVSENGNTTTYTYDVYNREITTTDELGHTSKKVYDASGNVIKEIDALGHETSTSYDALGNVISTSDARGNTAIKKYDQNGLLRSETDAQGYTTNYEYNRKGQLIRVIDPYQKTTTYTYDAYDNIIEIEMEGVVLERKQYDTYGREIYTENNDGAYTNVYDDYNRIIEKTNERTGLTTYSEYDDYGNVIKEYDSEGQTTTYTYDTYQRKIESIDPYGRKETLHYDARNHVIETNHYDGTTTSSVYDIQGNEIESTDALGNITKKTYDARNQLIKEETNNHTKEYAYDANGRQTIAYDRTQGTKTEQIYDANGNNIETIDVFGYHTKQIYDEKNQVIETIDALGNAYHKEYDAYGNVVKEIDPLGNTKQYRYNTYGLLETEVDERGFATAYEYDEFLLLIKTTDAQGHTTSIEYNDNHQKSKEIDANGGISEYEYDAYGRVIQEIAPNGKQTSKTYDVLGNVICEESGAKITKYEYDERGRLTKTIINDIVQEETIYNAYNQKNQQIDANGNDSFFHYDQKGNLIYSDEKGYITEKTYDVYGNVIEQIENETLRTTYQYDENHRLIETKVNGITTSKKQYDANGKEIERTEDGITIKTTYDACGRVIKLSLPSADGNGYADIQTLEYDPSGNVITIIDAFGEKEQRQYDSNNNVIVETNKNGIQTLYEYDGLNHMIKAQNHEERYVTYTYDEAGDNTAKTINQKSAQYEYDEDHHLIYEEDEYGYTNTYTYDSFGNQLTWEKSNGTTIHYTYDNLGNKLSENDATYTYDSRNNVLTAENQEGTITNTYDAFNQKTSTVDPLGNEVHYTYDENNRLIEMEYADTKVNYSYDEIGRLKSVQKDDTTIAEYEYSARNEIIKQIQNDTITTKTYDDMGRIQSQTTTKGNEVLFHASYTYDANDNLIKEEIDGHTNTYAYNAYDELIESKKTIDDEEVITEYHYDLYGNQITQSTKEGTTSAIYNEKNQIERIETEKGITYLSYDENGNLKKKIHENGQVDQYTYDENDQLIELKQGYDIYEYRYDAEKERIAQKVTDTKDYHRDVWYNEEEPITIISEEEMNQTLQQFKEKVEQQEKEKTCEPNEHPIDEIKQDPFRKKMFIDTVQYFAYKKDEVYYLEPSTTEYTLDRSQENSEVLASNDQISVYGNGLIEENQETIITGWNSSVNVSIKENKIKKYTYDDYGNNQDINNGHGYNQEIKDENGLIYLRARYYDPQLRRFIQKDSNYKGEAGQINTQNRYAFTLNNPYKYVDKDGNSPCTMFGSGGGSKAFTPASISDAFRRATQTIAKAPAKTLSKVATNTKAIATAVEKANNAAKPKIEKATSVKIGNKTVNMINVISPAKKAAELLKCFKKKENSIVKGIQDFGNSLVEGVKDFGSWIWSKVKETGSYVVEGFKNIMSALDDIMNLVATAGAFVAFTCGILAVGATMLAAVAVLAGEAVVAAGIGCVAYTYGTYALYSGIVATGASLAQLASGNLGIRLDGEKLTEEQARQRISNGISNLQSSLSGVGMGYEVRNISKYVWNDVGNKNIYPPNDGAYEGTKSTVTLDVNTTLGRYGETGEDSVFVTQAGGVSTDALSLPPKTDLSKYQEYKVIKPIPGVKQSVAEPWYGGSGGGLQYELPKPILELESQEYLVKITK